MRSVMKTGVDNVPSKEVTTTKRAKSDVRVAGIAKKQT